MSSFPHYVTFQNGRKIPVIGLGTWTPNKEEDMEKPVDDALKVGYRHIDTAYLYRNEDKIGNVLKKWFKEGKLKREDIFVTTKLPVIGLKPDLVPHFLKLSLKSLQLDYADLYLVHAPVLLKYISDTDYFPMDSEGNAQLDIETNLEEVWKAMEAQVDAGLTKSIGISNFNVKQVERIVKVARISPANIQVELHVYFQQKKLREVCGKHNITICAYGPLGSLGRIGHYLSEGEVIHGVLDDPIVKELATKYKKTAAQILLRFLVQMGIVVIPKSSNPSRIKENFEIFDFELDNPDLGRLIALDKGKEGQTFNSARFKKLRLHPEFPFGDYDG